MADNTVDVKFGGDSGDAQKAIADVTKALKDGVGSMQGSLSTLAEGFSKFSGMLAGFTAILAGGAMFKDAISSTLALNTEIAALSKKMGITSDEAVNLSLSLKLVGASTDSYVHASTMLDRQLRTNEDGLKQMGVVTRDGNGDLKKQTEIMSSAFSAMMQYKEGTDRNLASQVMFGRGADETAKIMKVNGDITAEAARLQHAWNIEVNGEGIAASKAYKMAVAETGIAMDAMSDALGKTILPLFVRLGEWFKGDGVSFVSGFISIIENLGETCAILGDTFLNLLKTCEDVFPAISKLMGDTFEGDAEKSMNIFTRTIKLLNIALLYTQQAFESFCISVKGLFSQLANTIEFVSAAMQAKIGPNMWEEVKAAYADGAQKAEKIAEDMLNNIGELADKTALKVLAVTGAKVGSLEDSDADNDTGPHPSGGSKAFVAPDKGKDKAEPDKRLQEWKNQLEQMKEAEGDYFKNSKQMEEDYWTAKLAEVQGDGEKEKAIRRSIEHELYSIHKANAIQERSIEDEKSTAIKDAATFEIATRRETLKTKLDLGQINAQQEIAGEKELADQQYQVDLAALQRKLELYNQDALAAAKTQEQIEQLTRAHSLTIQKLEGDAAKEIKKQFENLLSPITSAISSSVTGMIQGTTTMAKALQNIFQSILASFVNMIAQMVAKWAAAELAKTALAQKGSVLRLMLEKAGLLESAATTVTTDATKTAATVAASEAQIPAVAGLAAGEAASSVASIPYVGPAMAAAAWAETYALVMSGMAGFAVGSWNVPGDMITKIHQGEMIVPAQFAENVREGGGLGGGGDIHFHVQAVDAAGVHRLLKDNAAALSEVLRRQARNFTPQRA